MKYCNCSVCRLLTTFLLICLSISAFGQIRMTGKVTSKKGADLLGVIVAVEDTQCSAITDITGMYILNVPEKYSQNKVIFSLVGFLNDTIPLQSGRVDVFLEEKEKQVLTETAINTQKRSQKQVDVPIAVSVMDHDRIESLNLNQIDEMAYFIPGFQNMVQGDVNAVYGIRGVASDGDESYNQPRISVYQDGVSITRTQTSIIEPFDLSRIEVVKGPQGTLFGRGAEVGAVHYITNKPEQKFSANFKAGYGLYNSRNVEAIVNTPFAEKFANRFAARYDAYDGYIDNVAGGRLNGKSAIALRNQTSLFASSGSVFNLSLEFISNDNPGVGFKTNKVGLPDDLENTSPFSSAYLNMGSNLCQDRKVYSATLQYDDEINDNFSFSNTFAVRHYKTKEIFDVDGSYLNILNGYANSEGTFVSEEARFNWSNGNNLTGFLGASYSYDNCKHQYRFIGDLHNLFPTVIGPSFAESLKPLATLVGNGAAEVIQGLVDQLSAAYPDNADDIEELFISIESLIVTELESTVKKYLNKVYSQDYWESTPDIRSDISQVVEDEIVTLINSVMEYKPEVKAMFLGLMNGSTTEEFVQNMGIVKLFNEDEKIQALGVISNVELADNYEENMKDQCITHQADLFGDITWALPYNLSLTMGLRGTFETMKTSYSSTSDVCPIINRSIMYTSNNGEVVWADTIQVSMVGRLVLNWKFDPTHNVYFSFSQGRRPGVVYFDMNPDKVVNLKAENLRNYELGIKGISQYGNFSYYAAFYYYKWLHFQSSVCTTNEDGSLSYYNDDEGKARTYGFDGSLLYTFNNHVSAFMDYAYCNGRFCKKDMSGCEQQLAGNNFRLMPEHTWDIGLNWHTNIERMNAQVYMYPNLSLTSKIYFTDYNDDNGNDLLHQSTYALINLNTGYKWKSRNEKHICDLGLYFKNITNTKYLLDAGNSGDYIGYPTFVAGKPFTFGIIFRIEI